MDQEKLVAYSQGLQTVAEQYHDLFEAQLEGLKREHGIDSPRHLAEALSSLSESGRLLNIGFVGRVKAGKSSLLNALFFDGKSVLPKAATPMTAALTTLTYGDTFAAEVEFFSEEDLQQIRILAGQHDRQMKALQARHIADITKRLQSAGRDVVEQDVRQKAERLAMLEMKGSPSLAAAKEQAELMAAAPVDSASLGGTRRLSAESPEELVEQLKGFVGAGGAYMPFTKIVHVYMPRESLRDIRVIDTPGTNDPVLSREERTISLLKTCDVVFVVSPAGQFLNEDDLALLDRVTLREGVQELALVASQVDSQLHDSEKRARLDDAINSVCDSLTVQARRNLEAIKQRNPEAAGVFEALLASMQNGVLYSSGICLTIEGELDKAVEDWGDEELTAWNNLAESYPDYFGLHNPEMSRVNLGKLGNIACIQARLADVRSRKQSIADQKIATLLKRKFEGLEGFRTALTNLADTQIELVKGTSVEELQAHLKELQFRQLKLQHELDLVYQRCRREYIAGLERDLTRRTHNALKASEDKVAQAKQVDTTMVEVQKDGVFNGFARWAWGGGKKSVQHVDRTVFTTQIHDALESFAIAFQQQLDVISETGRETLDTQLHSQLVPAVKQVLAEDCKADLMYRAVLAVINALNTDRFSIDLLPPRELRGKGKLKDREADEYMDKAEDFLAGLSLKVEKGIARYLDSLKQSLPESISESFISAMQGQIRELESQVTNTAQTLDRLELMRRDLERVLR